MVEYSALQVTADQVKEIVQELFGIEGCVLPLPGEMDFNFRIRISDEESYVLKISRPEEDENYLDFQQELLQYVEESEINIIAPRVIRDVNGNTVSEIMDIHGNLRKVRLLSWISGRVWSSVNPQLDNLRYSLGEQCGLLTKALYGFDHMEAHRQFEWDIAQSLWTVKHINLFSQKEKKVISFFQRKFKEKFEPYKELRKAVVHNDANDNNVIVSDNFLDPVVKGAIDYGDAVHTQIINDVAIACAYAIMNHIDPLEAALPLIKGYNSMFPLLEEELEYLYNAIAMRLIISITKSAISKIKEPENEYLLISEKSAIEVLHKWYYVNEEYALYSFREACGFMAHPQEKAFVEWTNHTHFKLSELFPTVYKSEVHPIDLSVSSRWVGHQRDINDLELFQFKIGQLQKKNSDKIVAGGYLESRALYTAASYNKVGNNGRESRSTHLGIDFWLPVGTFVHSLFDGEIVISVKKEGDKEYGGLIVLKHKVQNIEFYTLYGHLTLDCVQKKQVGGTIKKGECIGKLGDYPENGNWPSHLHFQILHSLLDYKEDFPGVASYNQIGVWKSICPDPNLLFKLDTLEKTEEVFNDELISFRAKYLGKSLSLQYKEPIKMVRGEGQYLIDQYGQKYLDTVNNVAHVGHEHREVVNAGQEQMALINTNSRYLHENINELAKELLKTLPTELSVVHFVNSGSEANELALRMVKAVTKQRDIIVSEEGYHGNTNACVDISSYKFDGKGGEGAPEYTHVFPLPDSYRGKYRGENTSEKYAKEVQLQVEKIQGKGRSVGALIVEPIISCGGQIELPKGFLTKAYKYVREAGGLCISDEVQVGCGRVGKTFWGFQLHDVVPDIVTIGKPLGNGHPIAAVICTQEVADKFANGMEYFNTFGGNPVSCAIGLEVLKTIKREKLQENALLVGEFLKWELNKLSKQFPIIGNVRGEGLFLGFELVDEEMNPLAEETDYLVNRMKDHGILMSSEGPDHNVLKIKPPIVFTKENAEQFVFYLQKVFGENMMTKHMFNLPDETQKGAL